MLVAIACPECGHLGRVPEKRLGHKVRCKSCGITFRPKTATTEASPETQKSSRKDRSGKKEAGKESAFLGLLKSPTVIEGAVMGAIVGVLTGVIIGAITQAIYAEPKKGYLYESVSQSTVGSAIGGGIIGFILGFVTGAPLGFLIGLIGVYFQSVSFSERWGRSVSFGILIGTAVTAIIVDHYEWLPAGAFLGAIGALIWLRLQKWEKASDQPIVRDFEWEEDEKPAAPKTDL
jgi:hypothetical protein